MKCSKCGRTETARWYGKTTGSPYCCSCYRKEYVAKNREKALAAKKGANSSEKSKLARTEYANSERGRAARREFDKKRYWSDPVRFRSKNNTDEQRNRLRDHYERNKPYYTEKSVRRNRSLDQASLGNKYRDETVEIYSQCVKGYEVDHIIPIKGYDFLNGSRQHVVCGLHVPWNLQCIPKSENRSKSCNLYSLEEIT